MFASGGSGPSCGETAADPTSHQQHVGGGHVSNHPSPASTNPEQQPSSQYTTPDCSPELSALQYAQQHIVQSQSTQTQQHLQQVPQQPLFQEADRHRQVVIQQLHQHHSAMNHHSAAMKRPQQQRFQVASGDQQQLQQMQQQILQQPVAMLQTPILYSNNAATGAASAAGINSPVMIKKGRFRVVKGGGKCATPANTTYTTTTTTTNDIRSASSTTQTPSSNNIEPDNMDATMTSQPVLTVKRGRFVVKKSAAAIPPDATPASGGGRDDVERSPEGAAGGGGGSGGDGGPSPSVGEKESPSAVATKGRGNERTSNVVVVIAPSPSPAPSTNRTTKPSPAEANSNSTQQRSGTKQRGRFLVKTGGLGNGPFVSPAFTDAVVSISSSDAMMANHHHHHHHQQQQQQQQQHGASDTTMASPPHAGVVAADDVDDTSGNALGGGGGGGGGGVGVGGDVKKKGRFVVKTGGMTTPPVANSMASGRTNAIPPPSALNGAHNNVVPGSNQVPPPPPPSNIHIVDNSVPVHAPPGPASMVDANAHHATVASSNVTLPSPTTQAMRPQHAPTPQMPLLQQSQLSIPSVQGAGSSIGTACSIGSQQNQRPPPLLPPPQANASDAYPHPPQAHRRAATEARLPAEYPSPPKAANGASHPAAGKSSGWLGGTRGRNGRMIGGGGVGKVLHYLDTMRTEIVEADRCIASLQSDNRFLRDKNKELEAKNKDLERRLADEKRLRQKAEAKCASLFQRGHQEIEPAPSTDVDTRKDNCRSAHPAHEHASEERQNSSRGVCLEEMQSTTSDVFNNFKKPQQHPAQIGQSNPPKPLSRQNSLDESSAARSQTVTASQSTMGLSSIANQFDPLGAVIPVSNGSGSTTQTGDTNAKTGMSHFDPLGTPCDIDPVRVPLNGVPLMPDKASDNPQPSADHAKYTLNNINARASHFDPLGTPERPGLCLKANNDAISAVMVNGLPQIPDIASTGRESNDDPFDEIVRMSHSQLQSYD
ncbi:hypothetical protein ACHAXA_011004 [Cyclostephanos tholiformis]|uniref:Uncharacterized protein n=1 Tax=Cyclostephanos tholiformis TaxID=382380 RepID=A0ABD3R279_9STRA